MCALPWHQQLKSELVRRKQTGKYRQRRTRVGKQGVHVVIDGKPVLSFCSNDYLGLANHPLITKALVEAAEKSGVGSGAAHLLTGHSNYHHALETTLAEFTGHERVLLFSSGYQANTSVISALMGRGDVVIQDKLNHASLLDGGRLSFAQQVRYRHSDMTNLNMRLTQSARAAKRLIVSDGVFSMDGDLAPLPALIAFAKEYNSALMIDDAHGFGILGDGGRGSASHWHIADADKPIMVGTFGKALGTAGAFVAADDYVIETLIQQARPYIYTTAQPAPLAAATLAGLKLMQKEQWRRDKLQVLIDQFKQGIAALGLNMMPSSTPIQPLIVGDDKSALVLGNALEKMGVLVGVIRSPTVPNKSARLRITLSANHTDEDIKTLLTALENAYAH